MQTKVVANPVYVIRGTVCGFTRKSRHWWIPRKPAITVRIDEVDRELFFRLKGSKRSNNDKHKPTPLFCNVMLGYNEDPWSEYRIDQRVELTFNSAPPNSVSIKHI
jgi:hypothetical protein